MITDALNIFGQSGGFDRILGAIRAAIDGRETVTIEYLVSIFSFLSRTQTLWHAQFQVKYIPTLTDCLLEVLCYRNPEANENNK